MSNLKQLTISEAKDLLDSKKISSVELTQETLAVVKQTDPEINAFITVTEELALSQAKMADEKREKGENISALTGIPYTLKDVYQVKGVRTTAGSKILGDYISQYDASVYKKLSESGAVLIGKTNCDPFGFGSSTENSAFGVTRNPINKDYVPGGSSGGSGAATAYGAGLFSIGEDTGGSIRCPASFCGIYGLKPTYGRVSRYGSIAYASSYDSVGPMAKTAKDIALVLKEIAGRDEYDATSSSQPVTDYTTQINQSIKEKVIGIPKEYFSESLDENVRTVVMSAVEKYKDLGCVVKEISLPYTKYAVAAYYVVGISEASSNLARYNGVRYGYKAEGKDWKEIYMKTRGEAFTDEEKRRTMVGTYALSAGYADQYYNKAQKVRQLLKQDFRRAFTEVDIILTPTMPVLPFKIGEKMDDPLKLWLVDAFTTAINPVGVPALSVPAGESNGLPVGMQLIAPHFVEATLLNFAHQFEQI